MEVVGVTGANGFVGSHVVEALVRQGYRVRVLVRKTSKLDWLKDLPVEFCQGELLDPASLDRFVRGLDYLVHAAAITAHPDPDAIYQANVEGTRLLLEAVRTNGIPLKRLVFISSQEAVGVNPDRSAPVDETTEARPITAYGKSKIMAENLLRSGRYDIPWVILRPSPVFGTREKDWLILFQLAAKRIKPVPFFSARLSMIYVADLVDAVILSLHAAGANGQTYFIANPDSITWTGGLNRLGKQFPSPLLFIPLTRWLLTLVVRMVAACSTLFGFRTILNLDKLRLLTASNLVVDTRKAERELGFRAKTSLEDGFAATGRWYRDHGWI